MGEQYSRIFEKGFPWSGSLGGRDLSKIDETAAERLCGAAAGRGSERQPEKTNEFDYRDQGAPSTMQKRMRYSLPMSKASSVSSQFTRRLLIW